MGFGLSLPFSQEGAVGPLPAGGAARGYGRGTRQGKQPIDPHPNLTFPHPPRTHSPQSRGTAP